MPYSLVFQDQRVQNISTANAAPPPEAEVSAIIEHVVKLVSDHQTTTACAMHRHPLCRFGPDRCYHFSGEVSDFFPRNAIRQARWSNCRLNHQQRTATRTRRAFRKNWAAIPPSMRLHRIESFLPLGEQARCQNKVSGVGGRISWFFAQPGGKIFLLRAKSGP
jgi:hypothetical protein